MVKHIAGTCEAGQGISQMYANVQVSARQYELLHLLRLHFLAIEPFTPHSYGLWSALRHGRIHAATREIAKNTTRAAAGAKCGSTRSIFGVESLRSCADGEDKEVGVNCVNHVLKQC